mgnify:CR=1 FL=1
MTIALPRMQRLPQAERGITIADFLVPIRIGERISSRARHIALVSDPTLTVPISAPPHEGVTRWDERREREVEAERLHEMDSVRRPCSSEGTLSPQSSRGVVLDLSIRPSALK